MFILELFPRIGCICTIAAPFVLLSNSQASKRNAQIVQLVGGVVWTVAGLFLIHSIDVAISSSCSALLSYLGLAGKEHLLENLIKHLREKINSFKKNVKALMLNIVFAFEFSALQLKVIFCQCKQIFHEVQVGGRKFLNAAGGFFLYCRDGFLKSKTFLIERFAGTNKTSVSCCRKSAFRENAFHFFKQGKYSVAKYKHCKEAQQSLQLSKEIQFSQYQLQFKTIFIKENYFRCFLAFCCLPRALK